MEDPLLFKTFINHLKITGDNGTIWQKEQKKCGLWTKEDNTHPSKYKILEHRESRGGLISI